MRWVTKKGQMVVVDSGCGRGKLSLIDLSQAYWLVAVLLRKFIRSVAGFDTSTLYLGQWR